MAHSFLLDNCSYHIDIQHFYGLLLCELAVIVSKETHCFRVVSNLDNTFKDTLEKEITTTILL